jgi:hypothetical protein
LEEVMALLIKISGKAKDVFPAIAATVKKYGTNTTLKKLARELCKYD